MITYFISEFINVVSCRKTRARYSTDIQNFTTIKPLCFVILSDVDVGYLTVIYS